MIKYCLAGILTFLLPLSALAEGAGFEQQLVECNLIQGAVQRLDCYDELAQQLQGDENSTEQAEQIVTPISQSRSEFGLENRTKKETEDKIYIDIIDKWQNPRGAWRFRTAEGQEWHQTEVLRSFVLSDDAAYYIERGALGSFHLGSDSNNRTTRVRRAN
ncbi:hypothetical protein CWE09_12745 [Aliidiomarina minuta]|uniref:Uncharacterized protein n=1 Tax=Aliidiomarina minuta TaxID=880057 RepID=A0A432W410_9GAMM|nr:hypothetical protein [Aliidiomarina minuta]RUO24009.1 hypothetical protein CWE09_12745 [Aliidiomarina minuta]